MDARTIRRKANKGGKKRDQGKFGLRGSQQKTAIWSEVARIRVQKKMMTKLVTPERVVSFRGAATAIVKMIEKRTKNHGKLISPEVVGLKKFCLSHGIPETSLSNLHHVLRGWRLYKEQLVGSVYEHNTGSREFSLVSPDGKEHAGRNVAAFCREYGLQQQNITKALLGKRKSHKGWHLPTTQ